MPDDAPKTPFQRIQSWIPLILLTGGMVGGLIEGVRKVDKIERQAEVNRTAGERRDKRLDDLEHRMDEKDKADIKRDAVEEQLQGHRHDTKRKR